MGTTRGLPWWVVALIAAVVAGIVVVGAVVIDRWWLWLFLGVATPVFVGVLLRNPAHRFFRVGSMCLGSGIAMAATPIVSIQAVGRVAIEKSGATATTEFILDNSPWLAGLLILVGCWFYWIDRKLNQPANTPTGSHGPKQIVTGVNATATQSTQHQPNQSPMFAGSVGKAEVHYHSHAPTATTPPTPTSPTDNLDLAGVTDNPNFVGREDDLKRLDDALTTSDVAITHALTGEGGIGKTELARAYAIRYKSKFAGVWWLEASEGALNRSIAEAFKRRTGHEASPTAKPDEIRAEFLRSLPEGANLLILDNAESADVFRQFPLKPPSRVLATTQRDFGHLAGVSTFDVQTISEEAGIELILKAWKDPAKRPPKEAIRPIVRDDLAGHTYAVDLARSYFARFPATTPQAYRAMLAEHGRGQADEDEATEAEDKTGRGYRKSVRLALLPHLDKLKETEDGRQAITMLELAAFCHPIEIPIELLAEAMAIKPDRANALVEILGQRAMLKVSKATGHLSMHRLAQPIMRRGLDEATTKARLASLVAAMTPTFEDPEDHTRFAAMEPLALHALAVVMHTDARVKARGQAGVIEGSATLVNQVGTYLKTRARFAEALTALYAAERIGRAVFGPDHPKVAVSVNNIGNVLQAQGDLTGALKKYQEAERIDRAALGSEHPEVATDVNNIGSVLKYQGDLAGALRKFEEAERIFRVVFGTDHPKVAVSVNNIGNVLQAQGDLTGALKKYEEAERIDRAAFGPEHPDVATDVNNIGRVLQDQGDLAGALKKYEEAERIDRAAFGPDHPNVAICVNNIGGVLSAQGDKARALAHYSTAFRITIRAFGARGQGVATMAGNILAASKPPEAGVRHLERIVREVYKDQSPEVAQAALQAIIEQLKPK